MQKCQILPHIAPERRDKLRRVMKMKDKNHSSAASREERKKHDPIALAREFRKSGDNRIHSDVQGSYTGITREGDTPIQDADDL